MTNTESTPPLADGERVWGNYVLRTRQSVGTAARGNRRSFTGTKVHRITIEEVVRVIDEQAELALNARTMGKDFLKTRKPIVFSTWPNCGCCQGQHAALERIGATVTCARCQ